MSQPCVGWVGKVFGHRFEARYSLGEPGPLKAEGCWPDQYERILTATKAKTYNGDICVRCGLLAHPLKERK